MHGGFNRAILAQLDYELLLAPLDVHESGPSNLSIRDPYLLCASVFEEFYGSILPETILLKVIIYMTILSERLTRGCV